jgi:prolyl oligopeptidase
MWLEEVESERALEWAREQNKRSLAELEALPTFQPLFDRNMEIYNSDERIAYPAYRGRYLYNFWRDEKNERGLWRRTTSEEFARENPAWETVLDLDALAEAEEENWVWKGVSCLYPDDRLCILSLSRGGADATVRREYDTEAKAFVEGGFELSEAKSSVSWIDQDTLIVGTAFNEEDALTDSGYPNIVKIWKRGTPLSEAREVFKGNTDDVASSGLRIWDSETAYDLISRYPTFFTTINYLHRDNKLLHFAIPEDADIQDIHKGQLLVELKSDWDVGGNSYLQGSLLSIDVEQFLQGERDFQVVFTPTDRRALSGIDTTRNYLLVLTLDMVKNRVQRFALEDGRWVEQPLELPSQGALAFGATSDQHDDFFYQYEDFLTPDSLFLAKDGGVSTRLVKQLPEFFDTSGITVDQRQARSADGTMIPYFLIMPKEFEADGSTPTLLYGYGGFEVSFEPFYSATVGHSWVARGGAYVLANIRGGGEFGPKWHQAALRENRQKAYDDFIAVAEDLIADKVTSARHLGIRGGSNGGLLVGNVLVQRPELFNAVVCQVPLLDMKRYNKLLAGASWMEEYGDPDTDDWSYLKNYSPYQLVREDAEYPRVFFTTSTRDDRVHPAHARKMVAKMMAQGHPVLYYENIEGGHGGAANLRQSAYAEALIYSYLWSQLGGESG